MKWLPTNWKGVLLATLLAGAFATGWWKGGDAVQRKWDADTVREVKEQLIENQEDAAKLKKLEETKNENIEYVSNLYFGLGKSQRLRLPTQPCGGSNPPGTDSPSSEGIVSSGVQGSAEEAINEFDKRWADEAYRADRVVEDCRVFSEFGR